MREMTFCEIVLDQLPYVTKREREAIRVELEDHLADHAAALEGQGVNPEEARAQAEEAMGDPEEIGRALAKQYPRLWLWGNRLLTLCVAALCVMFLLRGPVMWIYYYRSNQLARNDPWETGRVYPVDGDVTLDVDFQAELLTDILRVYRVQVNRETMEANVHFVIYDQTPWGAASYGSSDNIYLTNRAGEVSHYVGDNAQSYVSFFAWGSMEINTYFMLADWAQFLTGATIDRGASYGYCRVPVSPGDDHVTFRYEHFGVEAVFEVPLPDWEGEI